MPTINIPPKVRFILYLIAALGSALVVYAMDKQWAGEAEFKLWTGVAGLLNMLAALKTSVSDEPTVITGTVETSGDGEFAATVDERGATNAELAIFMGLLAALLLLFVLVAF